MAVMRSLHQGEQLVSPQTVVVQTAAGRATHLPGVTAGQTACGDSWFRTRLRTDSDPTCQWCRACLEEAA